MLKRLCKVFTTLTHGVVEGQFLLPRPKLLALDDVLGAHLGLPLTEALVAVGRDLHEALALRVERPHGQYCRGVCRQAFPMHK